MKRSTLSQRLSSSITQKSSGLLLLDPTPETLNGGQYIRKREHLIFGRETR